MEVLERKKFRTKWIELMQEVIGGGVGITSQRIISKLIKG
jgi:hypothetical protein